MPKPRKTAALQLEQEHRGAPEWDRAGALDGVIDRVADRIRDYFVLEEEAEHQVRDLLALDGAQSRLRAVRHELGRFWNPALVGALLERSRRLIPGSPEAAREAADLAGEIAVRVPPGLFGERFRRDRLAEVRLHQARALGAAGDGPGAERALAEAGRLAEGTVDSFLWAELRILSARMM
jgi:hypothetical protein